MILGLVFGFSGMRQGLTTRYREVKSELYSGNGSVQLTTVMAVKAKSGAKKKHVEEVIIPDRLYFRIGEVAELCDLPTYVLRFWETEFSQLRPTKGSTGQRMYRRSDVETALRIKRLLYEEGFTIPGAREHLKHESRSVRKQAPLLFPVKPPDDDLKRVRQGLREILGILSRNHAR